MSEAKLADVWTYASSTHYSERECLAMDFALAAASQPNAVTDEQFAELQQHWSDGEIVELLGVVAMFAFLNRWKPIRYRWHPRLWAIRVGRRANTALEEPVYFQRIGSMSTLPRVLDMVIAPS